MLSFVHCCLVSCVAFGPLLPCVLCAILALFCAALCVALVALLAW